MFFISFNLIAIDQNELVKITKKCDKLFINEEMPSNITWETLEKLDVQKKSGVFTVHLVFDGFKIYEGKKLVLSTDDYDYWCYYLSWQRNIKVIHYEKSGWEKRFDKIF